MVCVPRKAVFPLLTETPVILIMFKVDGFIYGWLFLQIILAITKKDNLRYNSSCCQTNILESLVWHSGIDIDDGRWKKWRKKMPKYTYQKIVLEYGT